MHVARNKKFYAYFFSSFSFWRLNLKVSYMKGECFLMRLVPQPQAALIRQKLRIQPDLSADQEGLLGALG